MSTPPRTRRPNVRGAMVPGPLDAYPSFLGRGWGFPPQFVRQTGSVAMAEGDADIRESLWILLSTNLGERIMLPTYGCDLWSQVFTSLTTTTANEIANMVSNAIAQWEPRVTVEIVTVTDSADGSGWLLISIDYWVRQTNARNNLVYPFYGREATIPVPIR